MTKEKLKELLEKGSDHYKWQEDLNQVVATLTDGTRVIVTFKDQEKPKPEIGELSDFNKKLKQALNYNPKDKQ